MCFCFIAFHSDLLFGGPKGFCSIWFGSSSSMDFGYFWILSTCMCVHEELFEKKECDQSREDPNLLLETSASCIMKSLGRQTQGVK